MENSDNEYDVEDIIGHRVEGGKVCIYFTSIFI